MRRPVVTQDRAVGGDRLRELRTVYDTSSTAQSTSANDRFPTHYPLTPVSRTSPPVASADPQRSLIDSTRRREIRIRGHHESLRELAAAYGVSHETIRRIIRVRDDKVQGYGRRAATDTVRNRAEHRRHVER